MADKLINYDTLNILSRSTVEGCQMAGELSQDWFIIGCYIVQLSFCFISLLAIFYLFRSDEFNRTGSLLSRHLKMLVRVGWFIYLMGVLTTALFYSISFIASIRRLPDCEYIWVAYRCLIFRFIIHYSIIGLGIFHIVLLAERIYSLWRNCDENENNLFSCIFTTMALLFPSFIVLFTYRKEEIKDVYKIYCFISRESIITLTNLTNIIGVLDVFAMIGDLLLYKYNKYLMKISFFRRTEDYTLSKSFQLRERELSIRLIIPLSILHTLTFIPFLITYMLQQYFMGEDRLEFLELAFLIKSFYNMVIPLSIIYLQKRQNKNNTSVEWLQPSDRHADAHFRQLNSQLQRH